MNNAKIMNFNYCFYLKTFLKYCYYKYEIYMYIFLNFLAMTIS